MQLLPRSVDRLGDGSTVDVAEANAAANLTKKAGEKSDFGDFEDIGDEQVDGQAESGGNECD